MMKRHPKLRENLALIMGILLFGGIAVFLAFLPLIMFTIEGRWEFAIDKEDFDQYFDDFQCIVDLALEAGDGTEEYYLSINKDRYYTSLDDEWHSLTPQQQTAWENVCSCFRQKGQPDVIRVAPNRVSIHLINGAYALVYTLDGSRPTYANSTRDEDIRVRKLRDHWFHVVPVP